MTTTEAVPAIVESPWPNPNVPDVSQIREIEFIDAVPVSPSGKILRRLLRSP